MAADLEAELQEQLAEQQEALAGVQQLLEADPSSSEMAELLAELQAGIQATEEALLGLTRQRLLAEVDGLAASQHAAQLATPGNNGSAPPAPHAEPGSMCIFRHTDGRYYFGRVLGSSAAGVRLTFVHPTRPHQLEPVLLPAAALHPPAGGPPEPAASQMQPGRRVLVSLPGSRLWAAAEVAEVDAAGRRVAAVLLANKQRHVLPASAVALSAFAPDPHGGDDGASSASSDGRAGQAASSSGDSGEEGSGGSSSECDSGWEGEGDDGGESSAWGGAAFGRVSWALEEAAGLAQQQAEAGPQTETKLFFGSEAHSRGIGSKLLARMGFKGAGHGLGRHQQGMQQALQALALKKGAGLGVDSGSGTKEGRKKRKRSGKQRRRDRAAKAALEAREGERQAQRELEKQTGSEGLFAVLNSIIGDSSAAQAVKEASLGMNSGGGRQGGGGGRPGQPAGGGASAGGAAGKAAPKEEDRRQLARRAEELGQLRQKVQRLREMAARNARDKLMLPQIRRALGEAQAQLAAAEQQHCASSKAIHDREKLKRMTKF